MIFPLDHFNILSSRSFTWNNEPKENPHPMGIIEDSDLHDYSGHHGLEKQVYDDACDRGFVVRSERTRVHTLYCYWEQRDNPREPGEAQVWVYRAVNQWDAIRQRWVKPERLTEIHILND